MKLLKALHMLIVLCMVCALAACASFAPGATSAQVDTQYAQACIAYGAAFNAALQLREGGKLTVAQIAAVNTLDQTVTPVCTGPLPADPQAAIAQITAASTTLVALVAIKPTVAQPGAPPK